jgi:LAO/AO transport system kinase
VPIARLAAARSGDSLQFMKAGVMEIPDIVVVTKADTGAAARRAVADVTGALSLSAGGGGVGRAGAARVLAVSGITGEGVDDLMALIESHRAEGASQSARALRRCAMVAAAIRADYGTEGLARIDVPAAIRRDGGPFAAMGALSRRLAALLDGGS